MVAVAISEDTQPILANWLKQVGFTRGIPYGINKANRKILFLEYFDPGDHEIVYGNLANPRTTVVFGPRGRGKGARRVMLNSQ